MANGHPRKAARWITARYFEHYGLRDWVFACANRPPEWAFRPMLFRLAGLPIKRHTKVRSNANPFDPAWTAYVQRRANVH